LEKKGKIGKKEISEGPTNMGENKKQAKRKKR